MGQFRAEAARNLALTRRLTPLAFICFLQTWHDNRNEEAGKIALYFDTSSKERKAAIFFLRPDSLSEKEAGFRRAFSDEENWFADFIVGEYNYKNGNRKKALEVYRRSYGAIQKLPQGSQSDLDRWLFTQVLARLGELGSADKPAGETEKLKAKAEN